MFAYTLHPNGEHYHRVYLTDEVDERGLVNAIDFAGRELLLIWNELIIPHQTEK